MTSWAQGNTMECRIEQVGTKYRIRCGEYEWVADDLLEHVACEPSLVLRSVCGDVVDLECVEKYMEVLAKCRDTVNSYVPFKYERGFGVVAPESHIVRRRIASFFDRRIYVYQGGYFVEIPPELEVTPGLLRKRDAEIEIGGRKTTVAELLRRLGIDPDKPYRVVAAPKTRINVYETEDGEVVVTDYEAAGEVSGFPSRSLVVRAWRLIEQSTGARRIKNEIRKALGLGKDEELGWSHLRGVTRWPSVSEAMQLAKRVREAVSALVSSSVDRKLALTYLAVGMGGHVSYAVPHALVVTPPGTGKTFLGERICWLNVTSATEPTLLGGANVARGRVFSGILEGHNECVQIEHLETSRSTLIAELLQIMATGRSARGVMGSIVSVASLCPFVFTANVVRRGAVTISEQFVAVVSALTVNHPAAGRRFAIILFDPDMPVFEPSDAEVEELEALRLVPFVVGHPVFRDKVARLYADAFREFRSELVPRLASSVPVDVMPGQVREFVAEYTKLYTVRLFHAALNIALAEMIEDVWSERVKLARLVEDALRAYEALEKVIERGLRLLVGSAPPPSVSVAVATLPNYLKVFIEALVDIMNSTGRDEVAFDEVYERVRRIVKLSRNAMMARLVRNLDRISGILDELGIKVKLAQNTLIFRRG